MDELKKNITQKKRNRTQSPSKYESNIKHKYEISSEKAEYSLSIIYNENKNKIIIKCSCHKTLIKYEKIFLFDEFKKKNRIFNVCNNLEEIYKLLINIFNNKKAKIVEEDDSIKLILFVHNYIDNIEDNISFILIKSKNINDASDILENMENDNFGVNLSLDIIRKINELSQNDLEKNTKIQKLIVHFNQSLEDIKTIKKDILKIKAHLGLSDISENDKDNENDNDNDNDEENDNNEENDNYNDNDEENEEEDDDEDKLDEEEKEDDDMDNSEDDEKDESKSNIIVQKYQNKEDIQSLKAKLTKIIKKDNKSDIEPKTKYNSEISQRKIQNSNNTNNSYPKISFYRNIGKKASSKYYNDNNFIVFESLNNVIILVYSTYHYSIHFFDIEQDKLIKNIPEAHKSQITNFRYVRDKNISRDLILSIADKIKNIKIWNFKDFTCIVDIENVYFDGFLFSSCFLIDEIHKKNYIISINYNSEPLKVFNFEGKSIKIIDNTENKSYMVDTFFNSYQNKYFIIVGNENYIISYNFEEGNIYKKYFDYNAKNCLHMYFTFICKDINIFLIEADLIGYIRIWNFDEGKLLKKFSIGEKMKLRGICLWSENYLFVGGSDKRIKLIDLKAGEVIENKRCNDIVCTIKKINGYKFGECILMQGKSNNGQIKLWKNMNQN